MMTITAEISMTTPAGIPASSANAGLIMGAATLAGTPATDVHIPLVADTDSNAEAPARSAQPSAPVDDT
eukprot:5170377-Pyramimonas_sp.AAC.2